MPAPYNYNLGSPLADMARGFQFVEGIRQIQAQEEARKAEAERREAAQRAINDALADPSPENLAGIYLQFPELKDQVATYRESLDDADKTTLTGVARKAILLRDSGSEPEQVAAVYEEAAVAAENSNRPDLAKQFRDAAEMARMSPEGADFAARSFYQGVDPDGYKAIYGDGGLTNFQKDLVAANIDPESEEGRALSREYLDTRMMVQTTDADGNIIMGTPSELRDRYNVDTTGVMAPGEVRCKGDVCYRFRGGDPTKTSNYERVEGGPSQTAAGGF